MKPIEGQARGISRMIDEEVSCIDILTQVSALTRALQTVATGLLGDHLAHCVLDAARAGDDEAAQEKLQEPPMPSGGWCAPEGSGREGFGLGEVARPVPAQAPARWRCSSSGGRWQESSGCRTRRRWCFSQRGRPGSRWCRLRGRPRSTARRVRSPRRPAHPTGRRRRGGSPVTRARCFPGWCSWRRCSTGYAYREAQHAVRPTPAPQALPRSQGWGIDCTPSVLMIYVPPSTDCSRNSPTASLTQEIS